MTEEPVADDLIEAALIEAIGGDLISFSELMDRLKHLHLDPELVEEVVAEMSTFIEVDGQLYHLPTRADGLSLTLLAVEDDAVDGFIQLHPELAPLSWWLVTEGAEVEIGGRTVDVSTDGRWIDERDCDVLVGPHGWLDAVAGQWIEVTVTGGGLRITPTSSIEAGVHSQDAARALADHFASAARDLTVDLLGHGEAIDLRWASLDDPFLHALASDPGPLLAGPLPPLPDLYGQAGLEVRDAIVAEPGFDWDALAGWRQRNQVMAGHRLSEDDADALMLVTGAALSAIGDQNASDLGVTDPDEEEGSALLLTGLLERGQVATAFWDEIESRGLVDKLRPFAEALADQTQDLPVVAPSWLLARLAEREGRSEEAASLLDVAAEAEHDHSAALTDLAHYASDSGALDRAHRLLLRAGALDIGEHERQWELDDHTLALVEEVEAYRRLQPERFGRNDPCPCGSGRKYKKCHQADGYLDLAHRASWLVDKMGRFALRAGHHRLDELVEAAVDQVDWLGYDRLRTSPILADIALWEGKLVDDFVAARASFLPADEAALIPGWQAARRSVFEAGHFRDGKLTLHDLVRGGTVALDHVHASARPDPGMRFLARPVPVGETVRGLSPMLLLAEDELVDAASAAVESGDDISAAQLVGQVLARTDA